jgi:pimeloyl-ACP methyl ester carboxylesterase
MLPDANDGRKAHTDLNFPNPIAFRRRLRSNPLMPDIRHLYEVITRQPTGSPHETPLLFVHGAWHAAWCWDEHFLAYFAAQGYAAHALSLRGHGASWGTTRFAGIDEYVADVALVARSLPAPPVLIGHSMGGFVIQKYAERFGARALVLLASVPHAGALRTILRVIARQPLDALRSVASLNTRPFVDTPAKARRHLYGAAMPEAQLAAFAARVSDESALWLLEIAGLSLPDVERVRVPVLALGGAEDTLFPPAMIQATGAAYGGETFILPNMGHNIMLEPGWMDAADIIIRWLRMHKIV